MWIKLNDSLINLDAYSEIFTEDTGLFNLETGKNVLSYSIRAFYAYARSYPTAVTIASYKNKQNRDRDFNTIISTLNIKNSINEDK